MFSINVNIYFIQIIEVDRSNMTCVRMCSTPVQQDASSYCYKPCDSPSVIDVEQKVEQLREKLTVDRKSTSSRYILEKNILTFIFNFQRVQSMSSVFL